MLDPKSGPNHFTTHSPSTVEVDELSVGETITNVFGFLRRRGLGILVLGLIGAALGAVFFLEVRAAIYRDRHTVDKYTQDRDNSAACIGSNANAGHRRGRKPGGVIKVGRGRAPRDQET